MVIDTRTILLLSLGLLIVPLNWLLAALAAALVHEICHYAALYLLGGKAGKLRIGPAGASLDVSGLSPAGEIICALAGPLGGLCLLTLAPRFPRLALCAAIESAFNLLPIYPLDGGRVLRCILSLFLPEGGVRALMKWIEGVFCALIFVAALWLRMGWFPVVAALVLILRLSAGKIPCKVPRPGVQ